MKNRMRYRIAFLICFAVMVTVMVRANQKNRIYYLFNNNTGKLYRYYHLSPGEKYSTNISPEVDSLIVYSRLILNADIPVEYSYQFITGTIDETVTRSIKPSSSTRGVSGAKVSAWNRYKYFRSNDDNRVTLTNSGNSEILVKINTPEVKKYSRKTEYIAYPPDYDDGMLQVIIKDDFYTYYKAGKDGISMELEGPLLMKVVSRLIVNEVEDISYSWSSYLDGEECLTVAESSPYSTSTLADSSSVVTRGKSNIIQVPDGLHTLQIRDIEPDEIIYRFYLNKTAIGNE